MKRQVITILDSGEVVVPVRIRMTVSEIANLFGIYHQTVARHIREIEKSGIATGDHSMRCTCNGKTIRPDYYGIEMIVALAFRVNSWQADRLRRWMIERMIQTQPTPEIPMAFLIPLRDNRLPN